MYDTRGQGPEKALLASYNTGCARLRVSYIAKKIKRLAARPPVSYILYSSSMRDKYVEVCGAHIYDALESEKRLPRRSVSAAAAAGAASALL